jgi:hypothetical protein
VEEEEQQEDNTHSLLSSVICNPREEDCILYAIPCCAPYQAMGTFKYKVKLTPGTAKRGKAAKTALDIFQVDHLGQLGIIEVYLREIRVPPRWRGTC